MRYAFYTKLSKELLKEHEIAADILRKDINRARLRMITKGAILIGFDKIRFSDSSGDDFMHNRITAIIECDCYRIPRFLKKSLLKNFKVI